MRVLVTGAGGQLGHDVVNEAAARGHQVAGSGRREKCGSLSPSAQYIRLDITDEKAVAETVAALKPEVIVHCAAWTAVDDAEAPENRAQVDRVNRLGTEYLAEAARAADAKLLYISTDYVFSGEGVIPWTPDDKCAPLNVYGKSKSDGELAVTALLKKYFIIRTSWCFGVNGKNFVNTMLRAGKDRSSVSVVNDQIGTPTYTADLARLLTDMLETEKYGCYHATNEGGYISWYDFCAEIYRQYGLNTRVIPVSTAEYGGGGAPRPKNSRLDKSRLIENGFAPLPAWQDAVSRYLEEARL